MSHSAIGQTVLSIEVLVDHEADAGNGLTYFCDPAGHQWTANPLGAPPGWSDTISPNGAYQQWLKSADGTTASCTVDGYVTKVSYSSAAPNS
jgi:hypothetical protein